MIDGEPVGEELVLGCEDVLVAVSRELRAQSVARLARLAVPDVVRQDNEVLRGVEQLSWLEQLARKAAPDKLRTRAARAVHDQHGVGRHALRVLLRRPER